MINESADNNDNSDDKVNDDNNNTIVVTVCSKIIEYAKLVLPHVGLVILCVVYTIAGGVLFFLIERSYEVDVRSAGVAKIHQARSDALDHLWTISQRSDMSFEAYRNSALTEIEEMSSILFEQFEEKYISLDNIHDNSTKELWTMAGAMFFAITTVTTIGYGNLVPVTMHGRVICTIFGLFGIPLMLVTIADVGSFIGDTLKMLAAKCQSFSLRTCSTQKEPPIDPGGEEGQITTDDNGSVEKEQPVEEEIDEVEDEDEVDVPVTWILLLIIGYSLIGAFLFPFWENWTFFESFYFCFITMTTVGFGDYVPVNEAYYVITLLYIVLGLGITTMSVDLAAGQYIKKIHFFGRKIQSAKEALKNVSDIMKYSMFLKRRYGLSDKQMERIAFLPEFFAMQEIMMRSGAYTPADINKIVFIDQKTESLLSESQRSSVRTMEENMIKKLMIENENENGNHVL